MPDPRADRPTVSIVVVPRERFSVAPRALRALLANTAPPYELVYVDAGSPPYIRDELAVLASRHGFRLIRVDRFLSPNQARNLGLAAASGELVAFLDNDLLVPAGWLPPLVACAEETGAALVSPLIEVGQARRPVIHFCGGEMVIDPGPPPREARERHLLAGRRRAELSEAERARAPIDYGEFHCVLLRRAAVARLGPFDEGLLSLMEHLDLGLALRRLGEVAMAEPAVAVLAFEVGDFTLADAAYAGLRWGADWNRASLAHFARKWELDPGGKLFASHAAFAARQQRRAGLPLAPPRGPLRPPFAQTAIQLLNELQQGGLPAAGLLLVRRACDIAAMLHGDMLRASGKSFLAHLIGTGSVLGRFGAPAHVVAAGVLHAAYSHGRFPRVAGDGRGAWRAWLARELGADVEAILDQYFCLAFDAADGGLGEGALDALPLPAAFAGMVRVANEIEERLDQALAYSGKWVLPLAPVMEFFERLLGRLGAPGMVALLREMAAEDGSPLPNPVLVRPILSSYRPSPETGAPEMVEIRAPRRPRPLRAAADPLGAIPPEAALIGIAVVRDAADIIESFVRFNLGLLDGLVVADLGSADATPEILARLGAEGLALAVVEPEDGARREAEPANRLLDLVRQWRAPSFVLPLEADELLRAAGRDGLLAALQAAPAGSAPMLARTTYVPTDADPAGEADPLRRIRHRRAVEPEPVHKAVVAELALRDEGWRIAEGGRWVRDAAGRAQPACPVPAVSLAHVPVRRAEPSRGCASGPAPLVLDPLAVSYPGLAYSGLIGTAATRPAAAGSNAPTEPPIAAVARAEARAAALEAELAAARAALAAAQREAADRGLEAAALRGSTSWRITAPLRALISGLKPSRRADGGIAGAVPGGDGKAPGGP
jgi:GT2 family glycosyltransferase